MIKKTINEWRESKRSVVLLRRQLLQRWKDKSKAFIRYICHSSYKMIKFVVINIYLDLIFVYKSVNKNEIVWKRYTINNNLKMSQKNVHNFFIFLIRNLDWKIYRACTSKLSQLFIYRIFWATRAMWHMQLNLARSKHQTIQNLLST